MSTSRHAHVVLGIAVPRDHAVFGGLYPDEWLNGGRLLDHVRSFGDADCSDDVLIGVALTSVRDFSRGQDFAEVKSLTPNPDAAKELDGVIAKLAPDQKARLFVCGESF